MANLNDRLKDLQAKVLQKARKPHPTLDFKMQVVNEYLDGNIQITQLSKKYQISRTVIYQWISTFASGKLISHSDSKELEVKSNPTPMPQKKQNPVETPEEELARLREENKKLEEALKMAEWSNHAKDVMIDLAEKTFNIPIRKKSGAKQ